MGLFDRLFGSSKKEPPKDKGKGKGNVPAWAPSLSEVEYGELQRAIDYEIELRFRGLKSSGPEPTVDLEGGRLLVPGRRGGEPGPAIDLRRLAKEWKRHEEDGRDALVSTWFDAVLKGESTRPDEIARRAAEAAAREAPPEELSTRNLAPMPDPGAFERTAQAFAMLDAILSPEWESRYYSFKSRWTPAGDRMASMRNGSGDEWFALFTAHGAIVKGFAHESDMTPFAREPRALWPGLFEGVPAEFAAFLKEPAFSIPETTFCIWRRKSDDRWYIGNVKFPEGAIDPDGSADLLRPFDIPAERYQDFAKDYFEVELPLETIEAFLAHQPLSDAMVKAVNPKLTLAAVRKDAEEIGYPVGG